MWLVRLALLRAVSFVLFVAFAVAWYQNPYLIGDHGLTPANRYLDSVYSGGRPGEQRPAFSWLELSGPGTPAFETFKRIPTLLWFVEREQVDNWLEALAFLGMATSAFIFVTGRCHFAMMGFLWVSYHSIVSVGQLWYGFGWEPQLLETTFLAIWICPFSLERFPRQPMPWAAVLCYKWLLFRIMLGAGLIKLRGDDCWRDFSCMDYHYLTQPVPNPLSIFFHSAPTMVHRLEVLANHFVETIACWFIFLPQPAAAVGGLIQIGFQAILVASGNLSFLNWLTMVPAVACFKDGHFERIFSSSAVRASRRCREYQEQHADDEELRAPKLIDRVRNWALILLVGAFSIPVVLNLTSTQQAMNTSYDWLKIVNTYGAFGSVTRERNEIIIEGFDSERQQWLEYSFHCKPGNVSRRPCLVSPYHYRLDWLMWFAAFSDVRHHPWLLQMSWKLLNTQESENAEWVKHMLAPSPFSAASPPSKIRMRLYSYQYADAGGVVTYWLKSLGAFSGQVLLNRTKSAPGLPARPPASQPLVWWERRLLRDYMPEMDRASLEQTLSRLR